MIPIAIVIIAALVVGVYYYITAQDKSLHEQVIKVAEIKRQLAVVQAKANVEKSKLNDLRLQFKNEYALSYTLQDQYNKTSTAINKTDELFSNPYSENPAIKVETKTALIEADINNRREQINLILIDWKKKADLSLSAQTNLNTVAEIKKDAEIIKQYIKELTIIVNNLNTDNLNLSQVQIDSYKAMLVDVTKQIAATIAALDQVQQTPPPPPPASQPNVPNVPQQIVAQQIVVNDTQAQLAAIQQALLDAQALLDQQQANQTPPADNTVPSSTPPVDTTGQIPSPDTGSSGTGGGGGSVPLFNLYSPFGSNDFIPNLSNQPDAPQPLQGAK